MSIVYVVRHAESQGNLDPSIYGTLPNQDIPLSERGKLEAIEMSTKIFKGVQEDRKMPYDDAVLQASSGNQAIAIFSSPYKRTIQTAEIIGKQIGIEQISQNILLSERQYGEQEGCPDIDGFAARPMERNAYEKAGHLWYKPHRGESLMELYVRVTLFSLQHSRFEYLPVSIISSHKSTCQMFHAFFTNEMPICETRWENGEIRKYAITPVMSKCLGIV